MQRNEIEIGVKVDSDPSGFDDLKRNAERGAQKAGDSIVDELNRAGDKVRREAGSMAQAIDRELDSIPPPRFEDKIVKPAREAGESAAGAIGEGMSLVDMAGVGASIAGGLALLGPIGEAAGAAIGDEVAAGLDYGFNQNRNRVMDAVRTGLSDSEIRSIGEDAGEAWGDGFGEGSARELEQAGQLIANTMEGIDDSLNMEQALKAADTLKQQWGVEVPESLQIARDLVTSGLAPDTITAYRQMAQAQQDYQLDAEELNGVMEEFSSFMGRLGIDGATAWRTIGEATRNNVFPTVDRAGEMFEEFSISMQERSTEVRQALQSIGVNADEMFALFDAGRGAEAMATINRALADTEDQSAQNTAALGIYRMAWEGVTDPQLALEIYSQVDAIGEVGDALDENIAAIEANQTAFDRLKRNVVELSGVWGQGLNKELGIFYDLLDSQVLEPWNKLMGDAGDESATLAETLADAASVVVDANDSFAVIAEGIGRVGEESSSAADDVETLDEAFARLRGQFDGDQAVRNMHDNLRDLADMEINAKEATYELGVGFDQTTEAGGAVAAQLEQVQDDLLTVAEAFLNGKASTDQMRDAQKSARQSLLEVADQLNLTEAETEDLINRYGQVPDDVKTTISAVDNASASLDNIAGKLGRLPSYHTISVSVRDNATRSLNNIAGKISRREAGGPVAAAAAGGFGAPVLVNDGGGMAGPESARLPSGDVVVLPQGSSVNTAEDTQRILSGGGGGGPVVIHIDSGGSRMDDLLVEILRKSISNKGGDVQVVLGSR